jgi:hypothetical protein
LIFCGGTSHDPSVLELLILIGRGLALACRVYSAQM